jgi:hypothetical protein
MGLQRGSELVLDADVQLPAFVEREPGAASRPQ